MDISKAVFSPSDVTELVLSSLQEILARKNRALLEPLSVSTPLVGAGALLDSLGLVSLIVEVEQRLEAEHGICVVLADERAVSQRNSPFQSVQSLADYICTLIESRKR